MSFFLIINYCLAFCYGEMHGRMPSPRPALVHSPKSLYRPVSFQLSQYQDLMVNPGAEVGRVSAWDGWALGLSFSGHKSEVLEQEV